ncbi:hypothetical protein E2C01_073431 [Portunus trituberculatus]|uniref:Uncharacterized protein n=1 Tax=Portunus trituberculatus TaxID=210409 RepID=A0A5B7I9F0_PORTR|nr:hypothetical protein [Portunus trituberculatus]
MDKPVADAPPGAGGGGERATGLGVTVQSAVISRPGTLAHPSSFLAIHTIITNLLSFAGTNCRRRPVTLPAGGGKAAHRSGAQSRRQAHTVLAVWGEGESGEAFGIGRSGVTG